MTSSRILTTIFQMKSAASNRENFFGATKFTARRKAFDEKQKKFAALYEKHHRPVYRLYL